MQKTKEKYAIFLLFFIFGILSNIYITNAQTPCEIFDNKIIYVGGNGPGNYTQIQDAIDHAIEGDTVFVYDDSSPYHENLHVYKKISIIGESRNTTIIDGGGNSYVVTINCDFGESCLFTLSNFTLQNGSYAIQMSATKAFSIKNNLIIDNKGSVAVLLDDSHDNLITDNTIVNNNGGIFIRDSNNNTLSNNRLENNGEENESHYICVVGLLDSHDNIISDNIIMHNLGDGISFISSEHGIKLNNVIKNNTISYDYTGISLSHCSNDSVILGNNVSYNTKMGIYLWDNTNVTIDKNMFFKNNNSGIYIWADVYNLVISDNHIIGNYSTYSTGIVMGGPSSHNDILRNTIEKNYYGIALWNGATLNTITKNDIKENTKGVYLLASYNNEFIQNNFMGNTKTDATFSNSFFTYRNQWQRNYWERPRILPKPIFGWLPFIQFDWHPARLPNSIN